MKNWKPVDVIVLILACILGFSLVFAMIKPLITTASLSPDSLKLIAGLLASMLTIVSIYVGGKIQKNKEE